MEDHKQYSFISSFSQKYPKSAGALFATFNDLHLVQNWGDIEVVDLPNCSRAALRGHRADTGAESIAVPCSMSEVLSIAWVKNAFKDLGNPPELHLSVCTEDSSLVYYKISRGFTKPPL